VEPFGARLKKERERQGITLEDVASSTKIGTRMLRALEEEHFDQLPGGIFNKGFVRAYARHLKLDEDEAIADYLAASGLRPPQAAVEPEPQEPPADEQETVDPTPLPWGMLAAALLIVALGLAVWGFYSREKSSGGAPMSSSGKPASAPAASAAIPSVSSVSASTTIPAPQAASPDAASDSAASSPAPGAFVVLVRAREDSWVLITADGKEVMTDTLTASSEKSVEARNNVVVKAGNVGALDFWFNGKKLPPQGDYDEVKILNFDGNGLQSSAKTQLPVAPSPSPQP
jgi:cytoskeletal protein RodZ